MKTQWLILGGAGAGVVLLIVVWKLATSIGPKSPAASETGQAAIEPSPFLNTRSGVEFTGAEACIRCHEEAHSSYCLTAHSRALSTVDLSQEPPEGEFTDKKSLKTYRISHRDGRMYHQESIRTESGELLELAEFPMAYTIGSGRFSRSYLLELDGFLYESPATWYAARERWEISPGYDHYNPGFQRSAELRCLLCHAGRVESVDNSPHQVDLQALVIDCERCHGPGALHVSKWEGRTTTSTSSSDAPILDDTIVNPARLDRLLAEDICAQCHLHSAATVEMPGRRLQDFRPGLQLADFATHFGKQTPAEEMSVVGHMEQMRLSRCYEKSQTLTCTTCHHPHAKFADDQVNEAYRAVCVSCHATEACHAPIATRQANGLNDNCVACHMPRGDTEIPHFAFTHHRIGIHDAQDVEPESERGELVPLTDVSRQPEAIQNRNLGLAYLQFSDAPGQAAFAESYHRQSLEFLQHAVQRLPDDADVLAGLARLHWGRDPHRTLLYAERTMKVSPRSPEAEATAVFTLGSTHYANQQPAAAIPWLERTVQLRPTADVWYMLSDCYAQTGKANAVLSAAQRAARLAPDRPRYVKHLAEFLRLQGDHDAADAVDDKVPKIRHYRDRVEKQSR